MGLKSRAEGILESRVEPPLRTLQTCRIAIASGWRVGAAVQAVGSIGLRIVDLRLGYDSYAWLHAHGWEAI
jgi:hypothetical protein